MDWNQLSNEATRYLQDYIRIDTVNPPGNELKGSRFLEKIFETESIPCEIFEPAPGRGSILATLKGNGEKRPLLLLSHIDVVPAENPQWDVGPFEAVVKDGYLYGRGALDNKSMGIVEMMVLLILKREKVALKRDILFLAAADEETGGKWGIEWLMGNVPSLKKAEYALNEGSFIVCDETGAPARYELSNGQKVLFQLKLKAIGTSGHAAMPTPDNPNVKIVRGLEAVTKWETPFHVLPMVKEYFSKISPKQSPESRKYFEDVEKGLGNPAFARELTSNPIYNAMVRDTISLTILQAGTKVNVIPSESTATLDCRILPDTSKEHFLREIKKRLGNEIEVEIISEGEAVPPSSLDTDFFKAIQKFAERNDPDCPVVPHLLSGATDGRFLREKGIVTYDLCPFRLTTKELLKIHGHNERISLENLKFGMRFMTEVIRDVAT